jgi:hypothetical protein
MKEMAVILVSPFIQIYCGVAYMVEMVLKVAHDWLNK